MDYVKRINTDLKPYIDSKLNKTVVDLFAGCGGLSLGFEANGFETIGYEMDKNASNTYRSDLNFFTKLLPVKRNVNFSLSYY